MCRRECARLNPSPGAKAPPSPNAGRGYDDTSCSPLSNNGRGAGGEDFLRVRALHLLIACAALLLFATGCVTGGDDNKSSDNPTPGPQFAIVTLTPIPPGATIVIEPTATIDPTTLRKHTIKDGESLSSIAADYGVSQEELQTLNNIDDPNSIQVGQELLIPPS